jgi:hypothetical protein
MLDIRNATPEQTTIIEACAHGFGPKLNALLDGEKVIVMGGPRYHEYMDEIGLETRAEAAFMNMNAAAAHSSVSDTVFVADLRPGVIIHELGHAIDYRLRIQALDDDDGAGHYISAQHENAVWSVREKAHLALPLELKTICEKIAFSAYNIALAFSEAKRRASFLNSYASDSKAEYFAECMRAMWNGAVSKDIPYEWAQKGLAPTPENLLKTDPYMHDICTKIIRDGCL